MSELKVGDVLRLELGNGIVNAWTIESFYYGALGVESVLELKTLGLKPPTAGVSKTPVRMYVPANLLHRCIDEGLVTIFGYDEESE